MTVGLGTGSTAGLVRPGPGRATASTFAASPTSEATAALALSLGMTRDRPRRRRRDRPDRGRRRRDRPGSFADQGRRRGPAAGEAGLGGLPALCRDRRRHQEPSRTRRLPASRRGGRLWPSDFTRRGSPRSWPSSRSPPRRRCGSRTAPRCGPTAATLSMTLPCGVITDPPALAAALKAVTGVVDHGLFLGLAERALIGTDEGVITLRP